MSAFYGIVIEMYFADHPPPHFHAKYSGEEAKLELSFESVENEERPLRIEPLK